MTLILPVSKLFDRVQEIATRCFDHDEPVYLTTRDEKNLVVMSVGHYRRLTAELDLLEKLAVAEAQSRSGRKGITHKVMMARLRKRVGVL